jgi:hypothetical protein
VGRPPRTPTPCGHCGRPSRRSTIILETAVCEACRLRYRRAPKPCPGCGQLRVLAFYDEQRRPACARCTGAQPVYACVECWREDNPFGRKCGPCTLRERLTDLLADRSGQVHSRLQPVLDALLAAPRPQSVLYWLTRASSRPDLLRAMARGELEISHATFDHLPQNRAVGYLRDLLVAVGVLPAYHPRLARITPWLRDLLATLPKEHADLIDRFARWQLLRRLRLLAERDKVTRSGVQAARAAVLGAARLLAWLDEHNTTIATVTQAQLDAYLVRYPGREHGIQAFLAWTHQTRVSPELVVPVRATALPQVTVSDEHRWRQVEVLLHDNTIRLYARVAGLFLLLFAQPVSRICRMKPHQIQHAGDGLVIVTFDTVPIELPDLVDRLVLNQLARSTHERYNKHRTRWLFPGRHPGRHLATEHIRSQLVSRGIHPAESRKAALFQLAAEMPTPVLADLLGLVPNTASRWAKLAARDWSQYAAMRRDDM